ncbi:EF-hand domain-containing protein [Marinomonas rhizomae]|uniref:EF hand domain-containing protein n=1 Tax=Marinomonas rhizomae TaxID=491948 RepID=A0A366IZE5_9GAMM|nr:EF-hand domain-containing protein [Marinomonas rhizomae]RBP79439.1 EF hand domain-containing protein [Marinomonas rhizomae]RNF71366.1 EF-hand domain-containing protein [Marinomonas rhizomae]
MSLLLSLLRAPVMTATTLALFSISSMASEQPPREPPSFQELDKNGDRLLTKEELRGPLLDDFGRLDLDKSGALTEDELPAPPSHPQKRS